MTAQPNAPKRSNLLLLVIPLAVAAIVAVGVQQLPSSDRKVAKPIVAANAASTRHANDVDVGSLAPDFTLPDAHGENTTVTLSQACAKHPVLLIYYLGYSCPRCVANLQEIADMKEDFDKLNVQIIAAGPNTIAELRDSLQIYSDFPFPMLADDQMNVARAYGLLYGENTMMHGAFIIDTHQRIRFAMKSSHPYDNTANLLAIFRTIDAEQ